MNDFRRKILDHILEKQLLSFGGDKEECIREFHTQKEVFERLEEIEKIADEIYRFGEDFFTRYHQEYKLKEEKNGEDIQKEEQEREQQESIEPTPPSVRMDQDKPEKKEEKTEAEKPAEEKKEELTEREKMQKEEKRIYTIANGSVGKAYSAQTVTFLIGGNSITDIQIPPETGLYYDKEKREICGTPQKSGQFTFPFSYKEKSRGIPDAVKDAELSLYINADPKTLWKEKEPPEDAPFAKPHTDFTLLDGKEKRILAGRKRGRSHAHIGKFCDDDFAVRYQEKSGWYLMAVADGAGSAKYSRYGSKIAVNTAVQSLTEIVAAEAVQKKLAAFFAGEEIEDAHRIEELEEYFYQLLGRAAYDAMSALLGKAEELSTITSIREIATTLLLGMAVKIGKKWLCAAWWVGDGAVVLLEKEKATLLGEPDSGEFSGQTRFLNNDVIGEKESRVRTRCAICDDFTAFILMTDGVSDAYFESDAALHNSAVWQEFWQELQSDILSKNDEELAESLLNWFDFWSSGNHDDRTMAILYAPQSESESFDTSETPETLAENREPDFIGE